MFFKPPRAIGEFIFFFLIFHNTSSSDRWEINLSDALPSRVHMLSTHHLEGSHLAKYFCGHISRKLKPIWWCCCCALVIVIDFHLLGWPRRTKWFQGWRWHHRGRYFGNRMVRIWRLWYVESWNNETNQVRNHVLKFEGWTENNSPNSSWL